MQVFCDFDGTISVADSTDHVLRHLADPTWEALEEDWVAGRIDAAACMRGQVALIGGSDAELDAVLAAVTLDPGFADFAEWCAQSGVPLTIVSDGVDRFIRAILFHCLHDVVAVSPQSEELNNEFWGMLQVGVHHNGAASDALHEPS